MIDSTTSVKIFFLRCRHNLVLVLIAALVCLSGNMVAQQNYSRQSNYLNDPFLNEYEASYKKTIFNKKNKPPEYFSFPQDGFIVLLDSTVHYGKLSLYGRCYNQLYGVRFAFKGNSGSSEFNLSSLLAYGLDDQSINETEEKFEWENMFPTKEIGEPIMKNGKWVANESLDTAEYLLYVGKIFGFRAGDINSANASNKIIDMFEPGVKLKNQKAPKFYPHTCERSKVTGAYFIFKDGTRQEGFIELFRVDGVVIKIHKADNRSMNVNLKFIAPKELKAYGFMEKTDNSPTRQNETPSAFTWKMLLPGAINSMRETKKAPGYVNLPSGSKLEGDIQLVAAGDNLDLVTIEQGKKYWKFAIGGVSTFGILGAPKDESIDESELPFKWHAAINPLNQTRIAGTEEAVSSGYVKLKDGNKITGKLYLKREYGFITEITIKPNDGKKQIFTIEQVLSYSNDLKPAPVVTEVQEQKIVLPDNEPRPAPDNVYNSRFTKVPLAVNKSINESSEKYFEWNIIAGGLGKQSEKSKTKPGYVVLNTGDRVSGDLQLKRSVTKEARYYITSFTIKNPKGEFEYTQENVKAYGVDLGTAKALQPGDMVMDMQIAKNPKLIRLDWYSSEPKAGFVQLMGTNEVLIGLVNERVNGRGDTDIIFHDLKGKETKYKGNLLSHGYFENEPVNEFPSSVYVKSDEGYLKLIDNTEIIGRFSQGIPGIKTEEDDSEDFGPGGDPCAAPPPQQKTPPMNAFIQRQKEQDSKDDVNGDLLKNIFNFKIKTADGLVKIQSDLVRSFGLRNILISDITKNGMVVHQNEKLNFYRGTITLLDNQSLTGKVAYIQHPTDTAAYYGVFFSPDDRTPVKVYPMSQLKEVKQNIIKVEEYKPTESETLALKETSSTFDITPNGTLVDAKGVVKKGKVALEIPPNLWFATSVIYTDAKGVQEVYDKDNMLFSVTVSKEGKTKKYVPYKGVFVEVLQEAGPLFYFRNPFPSIQTGSSKFLNKLIDQAVSQGKGDLAAKVGQETGNLDAAVAVYESGMGTKVNVAMYKKEYMVFDSIKDRTFLCLNENLGVYTSWPEYEDMKNGCIKYVMLGKDERKALGKIAELETGKGIEPSLVFLKDCYYSGVK